MLAQITSLPTSLPTTLPVDVESLQRSLSDPFVRNVVLAAAALLVFVLVVHLWNRRREAARVGRARAELRAGLAEVQLQHAELKRLAARVLATSSTGQIAGFEIVRQIEAVFSDGQKSAELAVELVKAHAVKKGANAIINLHTQPTPSGKWTAAGDAVVVRTTDVAQPPAP